MLNHEDRPKTPEKPGCSFLLGEAQISRETWKTGGGLWAGAGPTARHADMVMVPDMSAKWVAVANLSSWS